jgi:outer membrane lipoprotein-sorting protein
MENRIVRPTTACGTLTVERKGIRMTKFTTSAAALLTLWMVGIAGAAPAPKTLTFNLTTIIDAQGMHVNTTDKVWVKGQRARFEGNEPMTGPTVRLVNGARVHILFPQQKRGTVTTIQTAKNGPKDPMEFLRANVAELTRTAKKTGQQTLDGFPCDIYQLTRKQEGRTLTLKAWVSRTTQPRLPLKVENTLQVRRPNMSVTQSQTTRITNLKLGVPIPDSLFEVPPGYKIVEGGGPGMPGLPGAPGAGVPGMRP